MVTIAPSNFPTLLPHDREMIYSQCRKMPTLKELIEKTPTSDLPKLNREHFEYF